MPRRTIKNLFSAFLFIYTFVFYDFQKRCAHCHSFYDVLEEADEIDWFQLIQQKDDRLELRLIAKEKEMRETARNALLWFLKRSGIVTENSA